MDNAKRIKFSLLEKLVGLQLLNILSFIFLQFSLLEKLVGLQH